MLILLQRMSVHLLQQCHCIMQAGSYSDTSYLFIILIPWGIWRGKISENSICFFLFNEVKHSYRMKSAAPEQLLISFRSPCFKLALSPKLVTFYPERDGNSIAFCLVKSQPGMPQHPGHMGKRCFLVARPCKSLGPTKWQNLYKALEER